MLTSAHAMKSSLLATLLLVFMAAGCKPRLVPNTNVKATPENKEIIAFLEQYKAALEKRSVDAIMEFIAKDFQDNMGTDDPTKFLDYLGLKERLEKTLPRVHDMRLGMFVQHIAKIDKDTYEVVFFYTKHVLAEVPSGDKWITTKEVSRMIIRKRHDKDAPYKFEIIHGV